MTFSNWAYIYVGSGTEDPALDRTVIECGGLRTTIVAVPEASSVVQVAIELVDAGAQLIELCGAFGPVWASRVIEGTAGRVPVGSVAYGMESVSGLAKLFAEVSS